MIKAIKRWFVRTFGPINQIQLYMFNNEKNFFDEGVYSYLSTKRWVPDSDKKLEIIRTNDEGIVTVGVFLDTKEILRYEDGTFFVTIRYINYTEDDLEYLYSSICDCYRK